MEISKESTGETLFDLTSYVVDTHASRSATQGNGEAKTTPGTCGLGYDKPLAHFDPDTASWRMCVDTLPLVEPPSLENLPPSGMTRNGVLFQQPAWEPLTDVIVSSLWPTPTAVTRPMEGNVRLYRAKIELGEMTEAEAEAMLGKSVWQAQGKVREKWPTPTAADAYTHNLRSTQQTEGSRHSLNLPSAVGGQLNPTWVECLMGFPTGWTD